MAYAARRSGVPRRQLFPRRAFTLVVSLWMMSSVALFACESLPAGTSLYVRLSTTVSSYSSRPGEAISAILTEDVKCGTRVVLPAGLRVEGKIGEVHKVGLGIRHETAALGLNFTQVVAADNSAFQIKSQVTEVYDARENVKNGIIHGVRGTDTPQGRINSRLSHLPTWNPYSDAALIAFKLT